MVKNLPAMQETWARSLGQEDPLEPSGKFVGEMEKAQCGGSSEI